VLSNVYQETEQLRLDLAGELRSYGLVRGMLAVQQQSTTHWCTLGTQSAVRLSHQLGGRIMDVGCALLPWLLLVLGGGTAVRDTRNVLRGAP
jgi:hypothetical protein